MYKNEKRKRQSLNRKLNVGSLIFVFILILSFGSLAPMTRIELSDISISRGETVTLFGEPDDLFDFSIVYRNAAGIPPLYVEIGEGGTHEIQYQGVKLSIRNQLITMEPEERKRAFTTEDWIQGVRFVADYDFKQQGVYEVFFQVEDNEGNIEKSGTYPLTISHEKSPVLTILRPTEHENIAENLLIKVEARDYDGQIEKVTAVLTGNLPGERSFEMAETEDLFDIWSVSLPVDSLENGTYSLEVIGEDDSGLKGSLTTQIEIDKPEPIYPPEDEPPHILQGSLDVKREGRSYSISIAVDDENPERLNVYIQYGDIPRKMEWNEDSNTYTIDVADLDPGKQDFTIKAKDGSREAQEKFTVFVLEGDSRKLAFVFVLFLIFSVLGVFYVTRRKYGSSSVSKGTLPDSRYTRVLISELNRLRTEASKSRTYFDSIRSLEADNRDLKNHLEHSNRKNKELQTDIDGMEKSLSRLGSSQNVQKLETMAKNLPDENLSGLTSKLAQMISYLSIQDFDSSSRALEDAVKEYDKATAIPTDREQVAKFEAQDLYESALKELRKAHAALDVRILELFLKRAREFLEMGDRAPTGKKISNYQICRKLSEEVLEQLKDPQLRARLRKLREAGYFDSLRLT